MTASRFFSRNFSSLKHPHKDMKVAIIGAGPQGLGALRTLIKEGVDPKNIFMFEEKEHIGGKCKTYYAADPKLKADYGAHWIAPNYAHVMSEMKRCNVSPEHVLPNHPIGIPTLDSLAKKTALEKMMMIPAIITHVIKYMRHVSRYQKLVQNTREMLPADYYLPFTEYAKKYGITHMTDLLKPVVPGFGYGPMELIPTHLVFAYTGQVIALSMLTSYINLGYPILGIQGGFQHLMEKIGSEHPIITSAHITQIERNSEYVNIHYTVGETAHTVRVKALIIATSPYHWDRLGMTLTPLESECRRALKLTRYPVAIVSIEGIDPEIHFFKNALEQKNFTDKQGEIALITSSHKGNGPRLCSVFQNLPNRDSNSPPVNEAQEREFFMKKLYELADKQGWKIVKIHDYMVWPDYMPCLPPHLSHALEASQMHPNFLTLYCTSVLKDGFEDVEKSLEVGERTVMVNLFKKKYTPPSNYFNEFTLNLFKSPTVLYNPDEYQSEETLTRTSNKQTRSSL